MAKPELGKKHDCAECGARFYDLKKDPAVCPKCGTKVARPTKAKATVKPVPEPQKTKPKEQTTAAAKKPDRKAAEAGEDTDGDIDDDETLADDDDDDEEEVFDSAEGDKK